MTDAAPFTFIIGSPRSGRTVLRAMIDAHPRLAVAPISGFLVPVLGRSAEYAAGGVLDRSGVVRDVVASDAWSAWKLQEAQLEGISDDASLVDAPATLRAVYDRYAASRGRQQAIDATPHHTEHVALLARAFPGSRFIHLVRDGRDVAPALRSGPAFPSRFAEAALFWRSRALHGRAARALVGPDRFHELRYEDLVLDPERHLEALCSFLGEDDPSTMLEAAGRAASFVAGSTGGGGGAGTGAVPGRTRGRRTELPARDAARFEALAGDALAMFGYDRGPVPSLPDRVEATLRHAADAAGKRARIVASEVRRLLPGS